MKVSCYYDYTCAYSYTAMVWLKRLRQQGTTLDLAWRTFSLKEANRDPDTASYFDDPGVSSVSVLALALAHAARQADFETYHRSVFEAMHHDGRRLGEGDLLTLAAAAGVDTAAFNEDRARWLCAVAQEHREGVARFGVFGTPTLVLEDQAVVFLKLADPPSSGEETQLWHAICTLARCHPELLEIKQPPGRSP
jgi:2-hydroxychromene-2-carboxylate isomerase